jgi:hypothetical protein
MIKLWRFLSVPIVLAVCLGLLLVPGAPPPKVALASGNVTIGVQPPTKVTASSATFNITVVVDNPDGKEIEAVAGCLTFPLC